VRLLIPLLVVAALAAEARAGSIWQTSPPLAAALKKAAPKKQRLVLRIGVQWCAECRQQEAALAQPELVRFLGGFHRLAYDAEQGEGVDVARRFNVVRFPTLLVLDAGARELGRVTGHLSATELRAALAAAVHGQVVLEQREAMFAATLAAGGEDDPDLRLELGRQWALRGERALALGHLQPLVQAGGERAARALLLRGELLELLSLRDHAAARDTLTALRKKHGGSPTAERAAIALARALVGLGKTARALSLVRAWAAGDARREQDAAWFCMHRASAPRAAEGHARRASRLAPDAADAWALLGRALAAQGRMAQAIAAMGKATELSPDDAAHRRALERYRTTLTRNTRIKR